MNCETNQWWSTLQCVKPSETTSYHSLRAFLEHPSSISVLFPTSKCSSPSWVLALALLIEEITHHSLQPLISPGKQHHIFHWNRSTTTMPVTVNHLANVKKFMICREDWLGKALEVLAYILWNAISPIKHRRLNYLRIEQLPICAQTISVRAPINWGVAFTPSLRVSSSTILPMENQSADFSRWIVFSYIQRLW